MLKRFYPGAYVDSVFDIDFSMLYAKGYRGILFDVDNTLVHHGDDSNPQVDQLFQRLHDMGFRTLLLSNNNVARLERFNKNIHTLYLPEAGKPDPAGYLKALELLDVPKEQALCIGDQIFTDILGANRSGIDNILVHYIQIHKTKKIGIRRHLENFILKWYKGSRCYQRVLKEET